MKYLSIKVKLLLLMIISVVSILLASAYFTQKMIEKDSEANLRDEMITIVRQIDSGITTSEEMTDLKVINEDLDDLMIVRSNIARIDLFSFKEDGAMAPLISKGRASIAQTSITREEIDRVKGDHVLSNIERIDGVNYWNVIAPVHLDDRIMGLIEAKISRKEFDALLVKQRKQVFFIAIFSVLLITSLLAVSMNRMIHRPIERLLRAMSKAQEGDLNVSIRTRTRDEFGLLSESFNAMIGRIRESSEANRSLLDRIHHFNEELQEKIHVATEELQRRNEALIRANQTLYQTQKQLGRSEKMAAVGQLAATVAHEVGTPLHSVSGHLQLLLEEKGFSSEASRRLAIMQTQIERVIRSVQRLLDNTRLPDAQASWIDANQLLDDLAVLVSPETSSRKIVLLKEFDPALPKIFGSYAQLQEVFLNLIDNALDALPAGGVVCIGTKRIEAPKIAYRSQEASPSPAWIQVTIQDNGPGIPEGSLREIFEPFFTTKERGKGTGLGLAICREIVSHHGGFLSGESKLNEGSLFTVQLPTGG